MGRHVPVSPARVIGSNPLRWVALGLLLAGCPYREPVPVQTWPGIEPTSNIVALDQAAWKLVGVQRQTVSRTADGRLRVELELASLSAKPFAFQVRTRFRDADGGLSGDETPFEMKTVTGNGTVAYAVESLKADAASFFIEIKTP